MNTNPDKTNPLPYGWTMKEIPTLYRPPSQPMPCHCRLCTDEDDADFVVGIVGGVVLALMVIACVGLFSWLFF
jgi:hypothetical protein